MAIFDWMANLAIDASGGSKKVFGEKPGIADYEAVDLGAESRKASKANLENAPDTLAYLDRILPGYSEMVKKGSANTLSLLSGEIPKDVQDRIARSSAYKSFAGGYGNSGMSKALTARDLGLTSLDLMDRGNNSAQLWSRMTQEGAAPFAITARDQAGQTERNSLYKQAVEQARLNVLAAPDPGAAGLFNTIATIGSTAASFGMGSALNAQRAPAASSGSYGGYGRYGGGG